MPRTPSAVESVSMPGDCLAAQAFDVCDHADAFQALLPEDGPADVDELVRGVFGRPPGWVVRLVRIRDAAVRPFGLEPTGSPAFPAGRLELGMRFGLFRLLDRTDTEIMLGADDRHLDFRVSVRLRPTPAGRTALVATAVRFRGWFGRAYFATIRPLHAWIVRALLRGALDPPRTREP